MTPRPLDLPESAFGGALGLARSGRFAEALESLLRATASPADRETHGSEAANALAEVARLAEVGGDLGTAERAIAAAVALRPRFADLHFHHGCVLVAKHDRTAARRAFDTALKLNPRYTAARVERAMLDAREGLVGEALESLQRLSRETAIEDSHMFEQGLQSLERADWDEADALIRRALKLVSPELEKELARFHALLEEDEPARAAQVLRELLVRHEAYPDLHHLLGLAELRLGHYDDALASLARALELHPDFHAARLQFARALDSLGHGAEAQEQVALVLEHDPSNAQALELQASWSRRRPRRLERAS